MLKSVFALSLTLTLLALSPAARAATETPNANSLKGRINKVLQHGQSLKSFYTSLTREFGTQAVKPLIEIATDERNGDETRWAALFGLARLAGRESVGVIKNFMSNSSWMLRDAALKTAAALGATELKTEIERRLHDDALIVRTTAVQTISHLNLKASAPKLVDALFDQANYHGGKALWIHKYILKTLGEFKHNAAVPKLIDLLQQTRDETLQSQVVATLESITGRSFPNKPIQEQIYLWKRNNISELTF